MWGDTLEAIANKFKTDVETLEYINKTNDIYVGNIIQITYYHYYFTSDTKTIKRTLEYCLTKHSNKKRYYRIV
jgi:LysM repeat protein